MLEIREINKSFPKTAFTLQNITCNLNTGLHILAGPNGAGKSTLLRIAAGIMRPDAGTVLYHDQDIYADHVWYKYRLGYLPQNFAFYSHMTGSNYLLYLANLKGIFGKSAKNRTSYVADLLGISEHCHKKISTWSIGLRQCLGIAQTLLNDPDILILDEPLYSLAFEESTKIKKLLYRLAQKKIILMSSHRMDYFSITRFLLLVNGTLYFNGPPDTFIDRAKGKVWTSLTSKEIWQNMKNSYPDSTVIYTEKDCRFRIISDTKPALPNVQSALPSLEEAYLIWLKHLNINEAKP